MEYKGSFLHSQELATCPYVEPINPVHALHPNSWRFVLIIFSHLCLGLPNGLLPSGLPTKTVYTQLLPPKHATRPASLIHLDLNHPNNICHLLHSPVTSPLLGPNILLCSVFSNTLSLCSSLSVSPSFIPMQHNKHNYSFVYLNLIFLDGKPEDKKFCTEW